jgi:hypothetical protein
LLRNRSDLLDVTGGDTGDGNTAAVSVIPPLPPPAGVELVGDLGYRRSDDSLILQL